MHNDSYDRMGDVGHWDRLKKLMNYHKPVGPPSIYSSPESRY